MAEDTKQPGSEEPMTPDASTSDASGQPQSSAPTSDAEKSSLVEEAKARVAAQKESLTAPAAPPAGAPKPPVKKKEEGPKPTDASGHPLVQKLQAQFSDAVVSASEFVGQLSIYVAREQIVAVCDFLRTDKDIPFDYLCDVTCVHYPERKPEPFEVVYNLYSIRVNERVRLKVKTSGEVDSVTGVWPTANWLEREVFDLFGVRFRNHPDLRRLLLPPDWEGHPMRKDYPLEFIENAWTERHLPVLTDVQREQLEQRRAYGLEILSVPQERLMREIFRGGKEVMTKDK
ncbi:MAG TPA: NADH-quinone oxidoreductase subunit C [Pyrinomonadaceae bacterium]